jgi:hypothetical protein
MPVRQGAESRVNDEGHLSAADRVLERRVDSPSELRHLYLDVRGFLSDIVDHTVADAGLVVVMLVGDAHRHGAGPVTLRLRRSADSTRLRVEVDGHHPLAAGPTLEDYRTGLLDRMTRVRGVERAANTTTTWAELSLTRKPDS